MKNASPRSISLIISLLFSLLTVLLTIFNSFLFAIPLEVIPLIALFLLSGLLSYLFVNYIVTKFIYDRIRLIYRRIKTQKFGSKTVLPFSSSDDVLGAVTHEVKLWSIEQEGRIKELTNREVIQKEFIGNVSHELKTPIFVIQGYVLTLLEGGLEDENINRKYLLKAEKNIERLIDLVEDLEQINNFDNNNDSLNIATYDIVALVQNVFESLEMVAEENNTTLTFTDKNLTSIYVKCDASKIKQVLTNFIVNSIKYGKTGGTTEVRFFELDKTISIEVSDDGTGIEENQLPRVFERFYRIESSRSRDKGGSGLGLAIVKKIIELHGQSINVRSTVGVGSTFSFTLEKA